VSEPLFYCPELPETGAIATLAAEESRHALVVRRLQMGSTIELFDGHGGFARARVSTIAGRRNPLRAQVIERRSVSRPGPAIHLACALPKSERQAVLLDMAGQLGVHSFTPLRCARSVVKPSAGSTARWQRILLEACKQSRRLHVPQVLESATPEVAAQRAANTGIPICIAHPSGSTSPRLTELAAEYRDGVTILVGPEGGFTEEEVESACMHGARPVSLGDALLRVETAAIAMTAVFALTSR
jgi:16S rRNA (uracil1498-N3)-methyltransferase